MNKNGQGTVRAFASKEGKVRPKLGVEAAYHRNG